jgi:hypothetical protein
VPTQPGGAVTNPGCVSSAVRRLIIRSFEEENVRTMAAVKRYAETHPDGIPGIQPLPAIRAAHSMS